MVPKLQHVKVYQRVSHRDGGNPNTIVFLGHIGTDCWQSDHVGGEQMHLINNVATPVLSWFQNPSKVHTNILLMLTSLLNLWISRRFKTICPWSINKATFPNLWTDMISTIFHYKVYKLTQHPQHPWNPKLFGCLQPQINVNPACIMINQPLTIGCEGVHPQEWQHVNLRIDVAITLS